MVLLFLRSVVQRSFMNIFVILFNTILFSEISEVEET